jgi:hypothetical protein
MRGQVLDHVTEGNRLFEGVGKGCPQCNCVFSCSHDLNLHKRVCESRIWRKSQFDDSYYRPSQDDLQLKNAILKNGSVRMAGYLFSLSGDGKWIKRKIALER